MKIQHTFIQQMEVSTIFDVTAMADIQKVLKIQATKEEE